MVLSLQMFLVQGHCSPEEYPILTNILEPNLLSYLMLELLTTWYSSTIRWTAVSHLNQSSTVDALVTLWYRKTWSSSLLLLTFFLATPQYHHGESCSNFYCSGLAQVETITGSHQIPGRIFMGRPRVSVLSNNLPPCFTVYGFKGLPVEHYVLYDIDLPATQLSLHSLKLGNHPFVTSTITLDRHIHHCARQETSLSPIFHGMDSVFSLVWSGLTFGLQYHQDVKSLPCWLCGSHVSHCSLVPSFMTSSVTSSV